VIPAGASLSPADWNTLLKPYKQPSTWRSVVQLVDTAVPLVLLWVAMLWSLRVGYWLTLLLAVPTALLLVRLFILQHDCGHGAFFRSQKLNNLVGSVIGVLTLMPYGYWRKTHAMHHATSGDLDHRGFGDIDTLTVREYLALSSRKRLLYRLYRHPLVLLFIGPAYQFILKHRFPADLPRTWRREWASVHRTNLALLGLIVLMWFTVGFDRFLLVQLPITLLSGSIGVFMFYVQHQYEDTYWRYREAWDYYSAGLEGSSHFVLPKVLQWFTGNIGLHHIHHVASQIPNYRLQRCFDENPVLQQVTRLTIPESVKTLRMTLWDEDDRKLVGFRDLRSIRQRLAAETGSPITATKAESVPKTWQ
jgi:omega-6 fatty acid desaturase (delta-12 desaturase)